MDFFSHVWLLPILSSHESHEIPNTSPRIGYIRFSPNSVSTPRGSYGSLIKVLTLGRGIFPVNFRIKWLLSDLDMRFDCAGSHKVGVRVLVRGIFPVNFRIKWLLL